DAEQQLAEEGIGHNLILRLAEETRWGHEHYTLANTVGKSRLTGADYDILTKRGGLKRVFNLVDLLFEEMKDLAERDVWESRVENLVPVKDRKRRARKISVARPLLYQLYDSKIEPDREIPIEIHDFDEIAHNWLVAYSGELGKLYPEMAINEDPTKAVRNFLSKQYGIQFKKQTVNDRSYYQLKPDFETLRDLTQSTWQRLEEERRTD
ncbi:MAG: hypothetical protein AAFV33_03200, partial [Chloroflexota bacterium]